MGFDKGDKFIDDAKQRAHDAIGESNPKLTSLEKGFLHAMKRRQAREKHARKGNWNPFQQLYQKTASLSWIHKRKTIRFTLKY